MKTTARGWALRALAGAGLALALWSAGPAAATGRADVQYVAAERFTDAGFGPRELARTQRVLSAHLAQLARRLPDGQVLRVEVRDIDLAGTLEMLAFDQLRVLGGAPDRPRLDLHYELSDGTQLLASGEAVLTDLGYLERGRVGQRRGEPLEHERRLLDRWFAEHIVPEAGR